MGREKSASAEIKADPLVKGGKPAERSAIDLTTVDRASLDRNKEPGKVPSGGSGKEEKKTVLAAQTAAAPSVPAKTPPAMRTDTKSSAKSNNAERPLIRRRPAGPARSRIAANDDLPSIGGLIFALQQKPSHRPFFIAALLTAIWSVLGTLLAWMAVGEHYSEANSLASAIISPATLTIVATTLLPIALFWFLALLAWRSQELRLVSSAMTEVAVRLAEPDRMAEQSVASLGQTVRRQVAAMNDAIARALGRAGELEALVHNEVAALERSYSENEHRIRRLIDELANERAMLNNNSERMGDAIRGIGSQVAREIHMASDQATQSLSSATESVAQSFAAKGEKITSAMRAAGATIDERLSEQGAKITETLVEQGSEASNQLQQVGDKVNKALRKSTEETTSLITAKGNTLLTSITAMNEKVGREMPSLLERLGGEQARLSAIIGDAVNNLSALESALTHQSGKIESTLTDRTKHLESVLTNHLRSVDKSLSDRTHMLDAAIGQRTRAIDASLGERAKAFDAALQQKAQLIDTALVDRTKSIDAAFDKHVSELDSSISRQTETITRALINRSEAIQATLSDQAVLLDNTFLKGVEAIRLSTDNLSNQSVGVIEALSGQAKVLQSVSEGLLQQVGGLTQKFENQGQAVLSAAQLLESSQFKMDSVLESRREELSGLLDNISTKAVELDGMMQSYSGKLESSLSNAQLKARELGKQIAMDSHEQSQQAIAELERMRTQTNERAETAIADLRERFSAVTKQVTSQIGNLSSMFVDSTKSLEDSTKTAAEQLAETQAELKQRVSSLPDETSTNAQAMRQALSDQLRAIDELNAIAQQHSAPRDISLPLEGPAQQQNRAGAPHRAGITASARNNAGNVQTGARHQGLAGQGVRETDLDAITASIASSVQSSAISGQTTTQNPMRGHKAERTAPQKPAASSGVKMASDPAARTQPSRDNSKWSMGDLLARASDEDLFSPDTKPQNNDLSHAPKQPQENDRFSAPVSPTNSLTTNMAAAPKQTVQTRPANNASLNINAIAQAVNPERANEIWLRYQGGERGLFSRDLYTREGQITFDDIQRRFGFDKDFRQTVNRYLDDFERLLTEADQKDPAGQLLSNYLNSDTGRVYLLLSHASGRLS